MPFFSVVAWRRRRRVANWTQSSLTFLHLSPYFQRLPFCFRFTSFWCRWWTTRQWEFSSFLAFDVLSIFLTTRSAKRARLTTLPCSTIPVLFTSGEHGRLLATSHVVWRVVDASSDPATEWAHYRHGKAVKSEWEQSPTIFRASRVVHGNDCTAYYA